MIFFGVTRRLIVAFTRETTLHCYTARYVTLPYIQNNENIITNTFIDSNTDMQTNIIFAARSRVFGATTQGTPSGTTSLLLPKYSSSWVSQNMPISIYENPKAHITHISRSSLDLRADLSSSGPFIPLPPSRFSSRQRGWQISQKMFFLLWF